MTPLLLLLSLAATQPDPALLSGLEYRQLHFARGGRSTAVTGVAADPFTFYFGGIGGGVWKSTDAGTTWRNVSDRYFEAGSVGAIAVSDSNPLVVYAGTGTACPRTNVSPGVGVYRSDDGGETWVHAGLRDAGQIGRIRIHPRNPDLVYAAVLGHASSPNATRGVFRSRDGGRSWQKVLFISEGTGIADLALDPADPRVLYAASWSFERKPWAFENGGTEGGIFKSEDGGDTWTRLAGGLPSGVLGRTAVTLSPARPSRVWALIEAPAGAGGLFRSDDAGRTWSRVNGDPALTQRALYFMHLTPHPVSPDVIYVLNISLLKSTDGGATFAIAPDSHEDHHDLWIHPRDPRILINGNDGGATVSFNGGATWSTQMNQPTGEMYRVAVDTGYPYRVYSAQQDAGTVSVPTASRNVPLQLVDAYGVGGGEASSIAVDPRNPSIVYATISGQIAKTDTAKKTSEILQVYPEPRMGQRTAILKYRTAWNMPVRLSPHDPDVIYMGSQHVHRSRDGGRSWEVISGDLTRNDKTKQEPAGSRGLRHATTGGEIYDTILVIEESPLAKGLLWVGTDDGLVHVSRDDGQTWTNVTPPDMPEWGTVSTIDPSVHEPGRAVIAVYRYLLGDRRPYIFVTDDYGRSWRGGVTGIDSGHYVRAVREDHDRKGLLYAGTEARDLRVVGRWRPVAAAAAQSSCRAGIGPAGASQGSRRVDLRPRTVGARGSRRRAAGRRPPRGCEPPVRAAAGISPRRERFVHSARRRRHPHVLPHVADAPGDHRDQRRARRLRRQVRQPFARRPLDIGSPCRLCLCLRGAGSRRHAARHQPISLDGPARRAVRASGRQRPDVGAARSVREARQLHGEDHGGRVERHAAADDARRSENRSGGRRR